MGVLTPILAETDKNELNMYRASDYPKDKVSLNHNTVEEQPVTSATTATLSMSHEAVEEGQVIIYQTRAREKQCFIRFPNTEKWVGKTRRSGVFF